MGANINKGFTRTLEQAGQQVTLRRSTRGHTVKAGRELGRNLLAENIDLPQAFFCVDEGCAYGLLETLRQAGRKVPADHAFISFGHEVNDEMLLSELTTVQNQGREKGFRAAEILHGMVDYPDVKTELRSEVIEPKLVVRKSCGC